MCHEAIGLIEKNERIIGVRARSPQGEAEVHADLVVGCDGRHSKIRDAAGLRTLNYGAPMDVLWFRIPRKDSDPEDTFGIIVTGRMMVLLNRTSYWHAAFLVPKGGAEALRAQPIDELRGAIAKLAPFLADRTNALAAWADIKTLEVRVDRLERWYQPGLLLIG